MHFIKLLHSTDLFTDNFLSLIIVSAGNKLITGKFFKTFLKFCTFCY